MQRAHQDLYEHGRERGRSPRPDQDTTDNPTQSKPIREPTKAGSTSHQPKKPCGKKKASNQRDQPRRHHDQPTQRGETSSDQTKHKGPAQAPKPRIVKRIPAHKLTQAFQRPAPCRINKVTSFLVPKCALLAMLYNQVIGLLLVFDRSLPCCVMGIVGPIYENSNTNPDLGRAEPPCVKHPDIQSTITRIFKMEILPGHSSYNWAPAVMLQ